jgi:hypothetical protein
MPFLTQSPTHLPAYVQGGKAKLFSELQSPTVYSGAIDRVVGRPTPGSGDVVLLCDGSEKPIGWGVYNPDSMFRLRIMQTVGEVGEAALRSPDLQQLIWDRVHQAAALRRALGLPSHHTNVYRLLNRCVCLWIGG